MTKLEADTRTQAVALALAMPSSTEAGRASTILGALALLLGLAACVLAAKDMHGGETLLLAAALVVGGTALLLGLRNTRALEQMQRASSARATRDAELFDYGRRSTPSVRRLPSSCTTARCR